MIKKAVVLVAIGLAIGISSCGGGGGSLCDRAQKISENAKPCSMGSMMPMMSEKCTEEGCSAADKEKISALLDCAEAAGVCEKGKELEWANKIVSCADKVKDVSTACNAN